MTKPITERIIIYRLIYACVYHGVSDNSTPYIKSVLNSLNEATWSDLDLLPYEKRQTPMRFANKAVDAIIKPLEDQGAEARKFALAVFYVANRLIDEGLFVADNDHFALAMDEVLKEGSTVQEIANIEGIDKSAQKMARRLLDDIRALGYFKAEEMA